MSAKDEFLHFFALNVTTSLKISGAVIPRNVFTARVKTRRTHIELNRSALPPNSGRGANILRLRICAIRRPEQVQQCIERLRLLDDLVGALLEEQRNIEAERLGGLDIDRKRELNGELDGKLARLCALENAIDVGC
jgi:hypothetical protein